MKLTPLLVFIAISAVGLSSFGEVQAQGCNVPVPVVTITAPTCKGTTCTVTATSGFASYSWSATSGTSIVPGTGVLVNTATVTWGKTGPHTVTVNAVPASGCAPLTGKADVLVPVPTVPIITGPDGSVCPSTPGIYYTSGGTDGTYLWGKDYTYYNYGPATITPYLSLGSHTITVQYTELNGCKSAVGSYHEDVGIQPVITIPYETFSYWPNQVLPDAVSSPPEGPATTYTSSSPALLVQGGWLVRIQNVGTATLTASRVEDGCYFAASASKLITITKGTPYINFDPIGEKTYGDSPFQAKATLMPHNTILYSGYESSNPAVATVTGSTITIKGAGTTTITANFSGSSQWLPVSESRSLVVDKNWQTIVFPTAIARAVGESFSPGAAASSGLPIEYQLDPTSVAGVVNGNSVTFYAAGKGIVIATQAGDNNYFPSIGTSKTYTITKPVISGTANYCGSDITLTVTPSGTAWPNMWSTGATTPTITVSGPGTYTVETTFPSGYKYTSTHTITDRRPTISVTPGNTLPTCALFTTLKSSYTTGATSSNEWYRGTTLVGNGATYTTNIAGTYTLKSIAPTGCAGTVQSPSIVNVTESILNISITGNKDFCFGSYAALNWKTSKTNMVGIGLGSWTRDGQPFVYGNPIETPGTYQVSATTTGGCTFTSPPVVVTRYQNSFGAYIQSNPLCGVMGSPMQLTANPNNFALNYVWYKNGAIYSNTSGAISPITPASKFDNFRVTIKGTYQDYNGNPHTVDYLACYDLGPCLEQLTIADEPAADVVVTESAGLQLAVHPNPAKDVIYVELPATMTSDVSIRMIDQLGRQTASGVIYADNLSIGFDVSEMPAGIYLVQAQSGFDIATRRVVVH